MPTEVLPIDGIAWCEAWQTVGSISFWVRRVNPRGDQTPWDLLNPSVARAYDSLISSPGWRNESRRMRPLPRSESCWLCDHNDPSQTTLVEHMLQAHPGKATF